MKGSEYSNIRGAVVRMSNEAEEYNSKNSVRRFYPMTHFEDNKMIEYGLYDYQTKKYVLFNIYSLDQIEQLQEMEKFFTDAKKIPAIKK